MIKGKIIDINADGNAIIQAPIDTYIFTHRKVKEAYIDYNLLYNLMSKV